MLNTFKKEYFFVIVSLVCFLISSGSHAHGGKSMDEDHCRFKAGIHYVHMSIMSPKNFDVEEFCKDVPLSSGEVIEESANLYMIFDMLADELRDMSVEVMVSSVAGETGNVRPFLLEVPSKQYPTGTIYFELPSLPKGEYISKIKFNDDGFTTESNIPFRVGYTTHRKQRSLGSSPIIISLFIAFFVYFIYRLHLYNTKRAKAKNNSEN